MIQFYIPDIAVNPVLPEDEAGHALRVLRKGVGDEIVAVDGKGSRYHCRITSVDKRTADLEILNREDVVSGWKGSITLAVAPTKNLDRMEWMVEKCVEIGVDSIVFLECRYSERRQLKRERLEKIAVSAMKQSLKAKLPQISGLVPFDEFISSIPEESGKYIAYCIEKENNPLFVDVLDVSRDVILIIGPEGDFCKEEVEKAVNAGAECVSLGESRLRTETAGVFSLAQIHTLQQLNNL